MIEFECNTLSCNIENADSLYLVLTIPDHGECFNIEIESIDNLTIYLYTYSSEDLDEGESIFYEDESEVIYFKIFPKIEIEDILLFNKSIFEDIVFEENNKDIRFEMRFIDLLSNNETEIQKIDISVIFNRSIPLTREITLVRYESFTESEIDTDSSSKYYWISELILIAILM